MRLWLTKDEEGLCLWRAKPFLGSDNFWYEEEDGFDSITEEIYHSLTGFNSLPKDGELVAIDVDPISFSAEQIKTGRIKNRRHK